MDLEDSDEVSGATGPAAPSWGRLSLVALVLNGLAVMAGIALLAAATAMTNIALVVLFLPILGLEVLVLTPVTVAACFREGSRRARVLLILSLVAGIGLVAAGTVVNAYCGADW